MSTPSSQCRGRVRKHIKDHFPEMAGVRPKVTSRQHRGETRFRFTYRKTLRPANGQKFQQIVHLTTDEGGKVLKVSVSR
jgi:hypothetical protein